MRTIGYAESSCKSGQATGDVYGNLRIIAAIARIDAKTAEKLDLSREGQHRKLEKALAMAIATESPAAMTSAIREQNEMLGYHRDKAPNAEKVAEMREHMDAEEIARRQGQAKRRTDELSGSNEPFPRIKTG